MKIYILIYTFDYLLHRFVVLFKSAFVFKVLHLNQLVHVDCLLELERHQPNPL